MGTKNSKVSGLRVKARRLAKILHPVPPERDVRVRGDSTLIPEFRPITGSDRQIRIPRIKPARMKKKRGRPKMYFEPRIELHMHVFKREYLLWKRVAQDLGMPLATVIRLGMNYFIGGKKMRRMIAEGHLESRFRKTVRKERAWDRTRKALKLPPSDPELPPAPSPSSTPSTSRPRYIVPRP